MICCIRYHSLPQRFNVSLYVDTETGKLDYRYYLGSNTFNLFKLFLNTILKENIHIFQELAVKLEIRQFYYTKYHDTILFIRYNKAYFRDHNLGTTAIHVITVSQATVGILHAWEQHAHARCNEVWSIDASIALGAKKNVDMLHILYQTNTVIYTK